MISPVRQRIAKLTLAESVLPTFHYPAHLLPDTPILRYIILKCTGLVHDVRRPVLAPFCGRHNDLLRVRIDNQVWVMRDENDLAPLFRCLEVCRQQFVNRLVVEIFVGLIDISGRLSATSMPR